MKWGRKNKRKTKKQEINKKKTSVSIVFDRILQRENEITGDCKLHLTVGSAIGF